MTNVVQADIRRSKVTAALPAAPPLLAVRGIRRSFGPTVALADCSFEMAAGEIHALVGENGSGKSTLIKLLSGVLGPDAGELRWNGVPVRFADPRAARRTGIVTCFQETLVVEDMSVRDNIVLGQDGVVRRRRGRADEAALARAALAELGVDFDLDVAVGRLKLAQRQLVTIARALACPWKLLILDESTSALDVVERDQLFEALFRYRAQGRGILFVSHRMDEIARIADRATVLRSGRSVATLAAAESHAGRLLELMSSREEARAAVGRAPRRDANFGATLLRAEQVTLRVGASPIGLELAAGEILGLPGWKVMARSCSWPVSPDWRSRARAASTLARPRSAHRPTPPAPALLSYRATASATEFLPHCP